MHFKRVFKIALILIIILLVLFSGYIDSYDTSDTEKPVVVATTTMIADLLNVICEDKVEVNCLMGPGIDPHLYQASAGDVISMQNADIVVYTGLHLEGKMGEIFSSLEQIDKDVICLENGLDKNELLTSADSSGSYDPHIWFDVSLWQDAASYLAKSLCEIDPNNEELYKTNLNHYLNELDDLNSYIQLKVSEIPENQRILITVHDAFSYLGEAYGLEVKGLQGISTDAEAGTSDVSQLAEYIAENRIKTIFVESSVPRKSIEALQEAVRAKGFDAQVGAELYSDSLGDENSGANTYILMLRYNIDTIVNSLK